MNYVCISDKSFPSTELLRYPCSSIVVLTGWWITVLEEKQPGIPLQQNFLGNWSSGEIHVLAKLSLSLKKTRQRHHLYKQAVVSFCVPSITISSVIPFCLLASEGHMGSLEDPCCCQLFHLSFYEENNTVSILSVPSTYK